jgi:hypothetical protein
MSNMSQGPILLFDKSFLQSLSVDEAVWLDNFFLNNITPLFFAETLADLEKEVRAGRTPDQVVGTLALKTPDMQAYPCAHHTKLIQGALTGYSVPMDARIPMDSGTVVDLEGKLGMFFPATQEEEALRRWYRREFLDVERQIAKIWRRQLCNPDYEVLYNFFQNWFPIGKPKNLCEAKRLAEAYIDGSPREASLRFGMKLFGIPPASQQQVIGLWEKAGAPAIRDFAPYFHHVYCVDLFYNLAVAADLISRVRPKGKADNKVDIAYVYYLPFCIVFTSSDRLHERIVPLFLRADQSFVKGRDLKDGLRKIDEYYSAFPEEVRGSGFHKFAGYPPNDSSFLVTQLWDKHLPDWRKLKDERRERDPAVDRFLLDEIKRIEKEAVESGDPHREVSLDDIQFAQMKRTVMRRKGKWERFGPDVK